SVISRDSRFLRISCRMTIRAGKQHCVLVGRANSIVMLRRRADSLVLSALYTTNSISNIARGWHLLLRPLWMNSGPFRPRTFWSLARAIGWSRAATSRSFYGRSEEHTSELQSLAYLVC